MEARDFRNKIIEKGAMVRYIGTLTVGKADKIFSNNAHSWIRVDSSGLFYRSDYLELLAVDEISPIKHVVKKSLKEKLLCSKGIKKVDPTQISDHNDGPGYGGG